MFPIAVAAVTVALAYSMTAGPNNTTSMTASDGTSYEIQNLPEKEKAVELMAKVRKNLIKLRDTYANDIGLSNDPPVARFLARFQPDSFIENDMGS
jgi:hypothetical protein